MISTGDLKKGITIELDGQLFTIVDWQHIKMGRGGAIVRTKLRNIRSGSLTERTFDAGERFPRAFLERRPVQYSYNDEALSVELPGTVDLEVTYTEPGFKGDTATGGTKPATLETGLVVQVPLFVTTGEKIRVKTDSGTYVERVS